MGKFSTAWATVRFSRNTLRILSQFISRGRRNYCSTKPTQKMAKRVVKSQAKYFKLNHLKSKSKYLCNYSLSVLASIPPHNQTLLSNEFNNCCRDRKKWKEVPFLQVLPDFRKGNALSEGSQDAPGCTSTESSMQMKMSMEHWWNVTEGNLSAQRTIWRSATLAWGRAQTSAVRGRRRTAWGTERPHSPQKNVRVVFWPMLLLIS